MPNLRRAAVDDAPAIAHVAEQAYAPYVARMGGQRPAPMDEDYAVAVSESEVWVVEAAGEVVGFLVLVHGRGVTLLDGVAVLPTQQGSGVGRALLALAEDQSRAQGHARLRLFTNAAMVENQRLYEGLGYVETHRAEDEGLARVFYEKVLTG